MAQINPDSLPWNFIYLTDNSDAALLTTDSGALLTAGTNQFPAPPAFNGSGGNRLLCTSYVVDMGYPRSPDGVERQEPTGPTRDRHGRPVQFD